MGIELMLDEKRQATHDQGLPQRRGDYFRKGANALLGTLLHVKAL